MSHLRRELVKILFQKRTYFGWAVFFVVPFLVTLAIRLSPGHGMHTTDTGEQDASFFFNFIASNGIYLAVAALFVLAAFLLPMIAAMAGSQTVAGEAENGTLRTVLMQPVRRGALLLAKWAIANTYVAIGLLLLLVGSLVAGGAVFGLKGMILLSGQTVGVGKSLLLVVLAHAFVLVGMVTVVSLSLVLSTLTNSGLAAMAGGLGLVIVMIILGSLSVFDFLRPYLFTSHFDAFLNLFRDPIVWAPIRSALINFAVWIAGTTTIAWLIFRRKDILS
jgi:ABC-2 type transport system permease protein